MRDIDGRIEENECVRLGTDLLILLWFIKAVEHCRTEGYVSTGRASAGRDTLRIDAQFDRMCTHPADRRLRVGHRCKGTGLVTIEHSVICNNRNHSSFSKMLRLRYELLDSATHPPPPKKNTMAGRVTVGR